MADRGVLRRQYLGTDLEDNLVLFRDLLTADVNSDAHFRRFELSGLPACLVYLEGMADDRKLSAFVLHARKAPALIGPPDPEAVVDRVLEIAQCDPERRVGAILDAVVSGMTALILDGADEAVLMETRGYPARQVSQATNESVVLGAQEGFVESLRTNLTLLRRYVQSADLISESLTVGSQTATRVALVYLRGVARKDLVDEARRRLMTIDRPSVQGIGEIQQLIEDDPRALLPQLLQTERPDRAASCLLDGQVVILADNSPYALAAPVTLFHQLHASDDSFARWQYGSFLRVVRIVGILLSVFLPGLYIALADHHTHLLPMNLLASIVEARANVPFPVLAEILLMEFSFYLINEAGTRIPRQIGSALGIVGALILGQAAVSASIISPILIIIVALTGLGNYAVPDYGFSLGLVIYRLLVILSGAALGLYGVCVAACCLAADVCAMRSLGVPYVMPIAPARPHNPDILLRLPVFRQRLRLFARKGDVQP